MAHRGRRGVLGASALRFSRTRAGAGLTALIARAAPRAVPGTTAVRPELLIMRHPVPIGPVHLLAVSRSGIPDAVADHAAADAFWGALASWLDQHAAGHGVVAGLTNLGDRQEVRLLHVHLIGAAPAWADRLLGEGPRARRRRHCPSCWPGSGPTGRCPARRPRSPCSGTDRPAGAPSSNDPAELGLRA